MKLWIACTLGATVIAFALLVWSIASGCSALSGTIQSIEQMPEDQFAFQQARVGRLTRGIVALTVLDPKNPVSPADINKIADSIDVVANDLGSMGDPELLSKIAQLAGIKDPRAVILAGLIQDFFPEAFTWGSATTLLGPHARDMLKTIAKAMRDGSGGQASVAEQAEAESEVKSVTKK